MLEFLMTSQLTPPCSDNPESNRAW